MLNWSREQLSERSSVHLRTIVDFEREARQPRETTLKALKLSLELADVTFLEDDGYGVGVRYAPSPGSRE